MHRIPATYPFEHIGLGPFSASDLSIYSTISAFIHYFDLSEPLFMYQTLTSYQCLHFG